MKILKKLFNSNDTKIHIDEIAMLMGGIPTLLSGAVIVESGSNTNGTYIKFGDGTLICVRHWNQGSIAIGANNYVIAGNWTFPVAFTGVIPMVFMQDQSDNSHFFTVSHDGCSLAQLLNMKIINHSNSANTLSHLIHLIAIGRWK